MIAIDIGPVGGMLQLKAAHLNHAATLAADAQALEAAGDVFEHGSHDQIALALAIAACRLDEHMHRIAAAKIQSAVDCMHAGCPPKMWTLAGIEEAEKRRGDSISNVV